MTEEQYEKAFDYNTRRTFFLLTSLSNTLYSLYYNLNAKIKEQNGSIDSKVNKKYKRLSHLLKSTEDCLLHLGYHKKTDDRTNNQVIAIADIYESFLACFMDRLLSIPEDINKWQELWSIISKLPSENIVEYDDPDYEALIDTLNIQPEKE